MSTNALRHLWLEVARSRPEVARATSRELGSGDGRREVAQVAQNPLGRARLLPGDFSNDFPGSVFCPGRLRATSFVEVHQ